MTATKLALMFDIAILPMIPVSPEPLGGDW